ncbi:MAG: elongator complex protein 3 [Minisyncoccia bacterium]
MVNPDFQTLFIKEAIKQKVSNLEAFFVLERQLDKKHHQSFLPFYKLGETYHKLLKNKQIIPYKPLEELLKKVRIRSLSGIVAVTLITKPYPCPGNCLYCPNIPNMPKSYLPDEPACMRALDNQFNPYKQMQARIKALQLNGHPTDKIELIILGGTWSYYPKNYQTWFIKKSFDGANNKTSKNLIEAQKINEKSHNRIIGLTIETRPDYINKQEVKRLRDLGVTRIELGVQSIYDDVLNYNNRESSREDIVQATKLLKNAGFKITYHMMPNLPGSNLKRDEEMFEELFSNPDFQPDQLKIYPCVVLKEAPLYRKYLVGDYKPYTDKELIDLLIRIKSKIPPYVRIVRVIRDIPSPDIIAGNKMSNLRQVVLAKMHEEGKACQCLRCREPHNIVIDFKNVKLIRREYEASNGKEIFLSYEDAKNNKVLAFLRLRLPYEWSLESLKGAAIVRELHSYGIVAPLEIKNQSNVQHKGLGKKLMAWGEKIIKKETNYQKIAVISGIGVRDYYRKLGYRLENTYLVKKIK